MFEFLIYFLARHCVGNNKGRILWPSVIYHKLLFFNVNFHVSSWMECFNCSDMKHKPAGPIQGVKRLSQDIQSCVFRHPPAALQIKPTHLHSSLFNLLLVFPLLPPCGQMGWGVGGSSRQACKTWIFPCICLWKKFIIVELSWVVFFFSSLLFAPFRQKERYRHTQRNGWLHWKRTTVAHFFKSYWA